jgi:peptidoglycan/LPS O-acetylase OafA/YrhL
VPPAVALAEPETAAATRRIPDPAPKFEYQPALDGLRALAVLAVLLYHAGVSWAPGGFLGVDAFFVLSGFLITSLLVDEWRKRGRIDFRAFWARRARRLLPALVLVVIAVGAYALFAARPDELERIRGDTFGSLLYVANWRQLFESSYFAQLSTPSPLRHTWSLGIEEQWYLVWPLALVLVLRMTAGRRWAVIGVTTALAIGSAVLMAALFDPGGDPSRVYYGTDTRAQALLLGAALALLLARPRQRSRRRRPRPASDAARLVGLECAGILAVLYLGWLWTHVADTSTWLYTGGFLVDGLAVAALIAAATRPYSPILGPVLSLAPLRAIGWISYGLYLWHWPVYVYLTPARTGLEGAPLLVVRLGVTFALALVSYRLVEQPIRHRTISRPRTIALASCLGVTAAVESSRWPSRREGPYPPSAISSVLQGGHRPRPPSPAPIRSSCRECSSPATPSRSRWATGSIRSGTLGGCRYAPRPRSDAVSPAGRCTAKATTSRRATNAPAGHCDGARPSTSTNRRSPSCWSAPGTWSITGSTARSCPSAARRGPCT